MIKSPQLSSKVGFPVNTELGIKVLDDTQKVADIKQKVLNFLNVSQAFGKMMQILGVDYSVICAE